MIKGLTHDEEGNPNKIVKFRGKISAGWDAGEGPNTSKSMKAAGYFLMKREKVTTTRVGTTEVASTSWVVNPEVQKKLEESSNSKFPKRIEVVSLYQNPDEMWESCLVMFRGGGDMICKSHGKGTMARTLEEKNGTRQYVERKFDGFVGCPFRDCPDFQSGKCTEKGYLKTFPVIDMAPNPYKFETKSVNTIVGIESSLNDMFFLSKVAHSIKEREAAKELPFDGLFGAKMIMLHRKKHSGGRDVFITDLLPSAEFTETVMQPIMRGLAKKKEMSRSIGSSGNVSLLNIAADKLQIALSQPAEQHEDVVDGEVDVTGMAVDLSSDNELVEEAVVETAPQSASKEAEASTVLLNK